MSRAILGIETSCDETSVALVRASGEIVAQVVYSQIPLHQPYGGVFPTLAAHHHREKLPALTQHVLAIEKPWAIAVTAGPGLAGGLIVGVAFAQALGFALGVPVFPINHLEGHALAVRMQEKVPFPFVLALLSGGHSEFWNAHGPGNYTRLGGTLDDALGECFDKVGRLLGLSYPAGPEIERLALLGDAHAVPLPVPMRHRPGCDLSFSGLKTAVALLVQKGGFSVPDVCAGFQRVVNESVGEKLRNAFVLAPECQSVVLSGGVAANRALFGYCSKIAAEQDRTCHAPPVSLCGDNGAMIAWAAWERLSAGLDDAQHETGFIARPRWPLSNPHDVFEPTACLFQI